MMKWQCFHICTTKDKMIIKKAEESLIILVPSKKLPSALKHSKRLIRLYSFTYSIDKLSIYSISLSERDSIPTLKEFPASSNPVR